MHALLALALLLSPLASPLGPRALDALPAEHDDLGRSHEPDFAATSVFGPWLDGRVIDADLDGQGEPDDRWADRGWGAVAPGCSDAAERRASGLCALGLAGGGWRSPYAPRGAVGLLDAQLHLQPGAYVEVNRKLDDHGLRAEHLGWASGRTLAGPLGVFAWHGTWRDANGNGVIDDGAGEFAWRSTPALRLAVWPWGAPGSLGVVAVAEGAEWVPMVDQTSMSVERRGWYAADALPALGYDPSALHTTIVGVVAGDGAFADVDEHASLSPSLDAWLGCAVVPARALTWVRDATSTGSLPCAA